MLDIYIQVISVNLRKYLIQKKEQPSMKNEQLTNEKKKTISKLESQRKEYRKKAEHITNEKRKLIRN